jgi:hypothetical protein
VNEVRDEEREEKMKGMNEERQEGAKTKKKNRAVPSGMTAGGPMVHEVSPSNPRRDQVTVQYWFGTCIVSLLPLLLYALSQVFGSYSPQKVSASPEPDWFVARKYEL